MLTLLLYFLIISASARNLVFAPTSSGSLPSSFAGPASSCTSYHGTYDNVSVYIVQDGCDLQPQDWLSAASIVPEQAIDSPWQDIEIIHVQKTKMQDDDVDGDGEDWISDAEHISRLYASLEPDNAVQEQHIIASKTLRLDYLAERPQAVHVSRPSSFFYAIPRALIPFADKLFPHSTVLVSVPSYPLPPSSLSVPAWLEESLKLLHYSQLTDAIIRDVDPERIEYDTRHLTNEDGKASWITRHSFTAGAREAAQWIKCRVSTASLRYSLPTG